MIRKGAGLVVLLAGVCGSLVSAATAAMAQSTADDIDAVRPDVQAVNAAWSKVRLGYDSLVAESMLLPDFYAALRDRRVTREEFIKAISTRSSTNRLIRFDNPILTITKGEGRDEWVALVLEKLEYERTNPDGTKARTYSMWVTRDGYRRVSPTKWQLMYTQEVMHQSWAGGRTPPFPDW